VEKVDVQIVDIPPEDSGNIRVVEDTFEFRDGSGNLLNQERGINMVHRIIFAEDLSRGLVEILGHCLSPDPCFFESHLRGLVASDNPFLRPHPTVFGS
jgi:hypothetical protein